MRYGGKIMSDDRAEELVLSDEERRLIIQIRELNYGEMSITVRNGNPTRIEEIRKSILLTD